MNYFKNSFFVVATIGILVLCGDKIYRFWQEKNDEKVLQERLVENRKRMDQFYMHEFTMLDNSINKVLANPGVIEACPTLLGSLYDEFEKIEKKMIHDGYAHAEVGRIRQQARSQFASNANK